MLLLGPHALSSSTEAIPQMLVTQVRSTRCPRHSAGAWQTAGEA